MEDSKLSYQIIRGAIEVHRALGPGLLESAYQECLHYELSEYGLFVEREKPMPIIYKEVRLDHGYRMDLLVERKVVVELKTVEQLTDVHLAQTLTYLKLGHFHLGLLINFHVTLLKDGVRQVVNPAFKP
ncbi:GxxExxY protein [Larkinella bovis]|uniref:GxxExxY protein n=1 Tax=Larkinella bovis TaxID=683041 RepID=A0ABW0IF39_9BACT